MQWDGARSVGLALGPPRVKRMRSAAFCRHGKVGRLRIDGRGAILPHHRSVQRGTAVVSPCSATLSLAAASGVPFGACLPADCTTANISDTTNPMFWFIALHMPMALELGFPGPAARVVCGSQREAWDAGTYAAATLAGILALLVLAGSLVAHRCCGSLSNGGMLPSSLWRDVLCSFSLPANWSRLCSTSGGDSGRGAPLAALDAVRVLSIAWVVLGHAVMFQEVPGPGYVNAGGSVEVCASSCCLALHLCYAQAGTAFLPPFGAFSSIAFQVIPSAVRSAVD